MPEADAPQGRDVASRLTQWIKTEIRRDMVNGYTALSPKHLGDGLYTMRVKDGRTGMMLTVTVRATEDAD